MIHKTSLEINKIHCGDCLELMQDIDGGSVDMILTDIPYNEVNRITAGIRTLDKGDADILTFDLKSFISECCRVVTGSIYIFCGIEQISSIRKLMVFHKLSTRLCIYEKKNPTPLNGEYLWLSSLEYCVFGRNKKATFNQYCESPVWRFNSGSSKRVQTEKSLKLFEYIINASSNPGDTILDPCIGSGTTAVGCLNTHRNFIGIELYPETCKIARKRIKSAEPQLIMEGI